MHDRSEGPRSTVGEKPLRAAKHVVSTRQENATILLDIRRGEYYTLNGVGGRVWALLSDGPTVSMIIDRLAGEFEITPEQLSSDVHGFVEQLQRSKLLSS